MRLVAPITALALACVAVAGIAYASARDDDLARNYAYASAGAFEAQDHCPGLLIDRDGLSALRDAAHLGSDKDDRAFLRARYDEIRPGMDREIAKGAPAWCTQAYGTFGPGGLHVLRRE